MTRFPNSIAAGIACSGLVVCALTLSAAAPAARAENQACTPGITQYVPQPPAALTQLGFQEAWKLADGNVLVAIVDSGVDAANAHLTQSVIPGVDLVEAGDGRTDTSGHGTAIAAQIAAHPVDGSGLVGMAPQATILPIRVYADTSNEAIRAGQAPEAQRTAEGIRIAADRGAKIIVVPQSTPSDAPDLRAAVEHATTSGALVIASAGNVTPEEDANLVRFPAAYPSVLSVTAVDAAGNPSAAVSSGVHVEVAAPGAQVLTAFLRWGDCVFAGEAPSTSYATGYVAAAAALVASAHPKESPADWEYRLLATALRPSLGSRDKAIGWGIVAPHDAINFINDGSMAGPPNPRFADAHTEKLVPLAAPPAPTTEALPKPLLLLLAGSAAVAGLVALMVDKLRRPMKAKTASQDGASR